MTADRILRRQSNVTLIILRYLQTQNMGCPSSNLFDMWIFGSRYVDTWFLDMLMHFFIKTGLKKYTFLCSFLKAWCWWLTYITWWHDNIILCYTILHIYLVRGVLMSYPLSCSDHWFEILLVYRHDKRHKDADLHLSDRIPARNMPDIQRPGTLKSKTNAMCRHCNTAAVTCLLLGRRMNQNDEMTSDYKWHSFNREEKEAIWIFKCSRRLF